MWYTCKEVKDNAWFLILIGIAVYFIAKRILYTDIPRINHFSSNWFLILIGITVYFIAKRILYTDIPRISHFSSKPNP